MTLLDLSQRQVLALDPTRHARVLGAPGTGKTLLLIESFARLAGSPEWPDERLLVLAPNRLTASALRSRLERRLDRAIGGTPVRTASSLAFAVLGGAAAAAGRRASRLLTGTAHDEAVAEVLGDEADRELQEAIRGAFAPEAVQSEAFRAELREMGRVLDDYGLNPDSLRQELTGLRSSERGGRERDPRDPAEELLQLWDTSLAVVATVDRRLREQRPDELTSSGMLRAASQILRVEDRVGAPGLILVDDAQELGEGELALLAACASRGSRIWAFGDPDIATGAFHGERTQVLTRLGDELVRRGVRASAGDGEEQSVLLDTVHRHGAEVRALVRGLTDRIGAAGAGQQRRAEAASSGDAQREASDAERTESDGTAHEAAASAGLVRATTVPTLPEQIGVIAHRLRQRRIDPRAGRLLNWSEMAVICRTRDEASRVARALAGHQVPTGVAAGGIVLKEQQIVRELIRLLQHALGIEPLAPPEILSLLGGTIGGLDPIAMRRLRGSLKLLEARAARSEERPEQPIDELVAEAFAFPGELPVIDSAGGRALQRLAKLAAKAVSVREAGVTARETLWTLWDGAKLASDWQSEALDGRGARADEAHRALDAVMGLFFALQRHEEQDSEVPLAEMLEGLLESGVAEDSLAARSAREFVTVTTPQGVIGREFAVVCIYGPQDGVWPNLRARGSLLGVSPLERWLRGGEAATPARRETLHDELRLFAHSCARASEEVLIVAVADEDHHPSTFLSLARANRVEGLPSSRLTLRGSVAEMRRRITHGPTDAVARDSLVALAAAGVPGAHPDEWYGVLPPSSAAPLHDLAEADTRVTVSPSHLERVERCPLDWAISHLAKDAGHLGAKLGTLLHHVLETADSADADELFENVRDEWGRLDFESEWESERTLRLAQTMTRGLAAYLADFEQSGRTLAGREVPFEVEVGQAVLRGNADRVEIGAGSDGRRTTIVVDLKTGKTAPGGAALAEHAQLQAYQLGVIEHAFDTGDEEARAHDSPDHETPGDAGRPDEAGNGGAQLLYVHPDALKSGECGFGVRAQQPLSEEGRAALKERVSEVALTMAASRFTARVEHHCSDPHAPGGSCRLHIIPAVSRA